MGHHVRRRRNAARLAPTLLSTTGFTPSIGDIGATGGSGLFPFDLFLTFSLPRPARGHPVDARSVASQGSEFWGLR
jgi:hypothetical protein